MFGSASVAAGSAAAQDVEGAPIRYGAATPRIPVAALQEQLATGTAKLDHEPGRGALGSARRAGAIPESSRVPAFSRTSLRRERIAPRTPRANDVDVEILVGFCNRGRVTEITARDFAAQDPRDSNDRSVGDFDPEARVFRDPCSDLDDSTAFDSLPAAVRDFIDQHL